MSFDDCVRYMDDNFAKLPESKEVADIQHAVEDAVSALLKNVAAMDERFEYKLEPSGSFYEGTKIRQPDEFDFMISLPRLARICNIIYREEGKPHALVRFLSNDSADYWSDFVEEISDRATKSWLGQSSQNWPIFGTICCLDGSKLKQKFYSLLRESLKCVSWPKNLKFLTSTGATFDKLGLRGATQRSASEKVDFLWKDDLKVSVDLALALECKEWPTVAGLFGNCLGTKYPGDFLEHKVKSLGCHVVPKLGHIWRISWTWAESTLLKQIFSENSEAAISYRVAKLINETHFSEVNSTFDILQPFILCESYTLKHLLISMWMKQSFSSTVSSPGCGEIVQNLLSLLLSGLRSGFCQQVFVTGYSTIKEGPLLSPCALALEKCIDALKTLHEVESSQVSKKCEDFVKQKEFIIVPSPTKKLWQYKIRKLP